MATLTIHIPDDKATRLQALADRRGMSVTALIEEISTISLEDFDAENRFRAAALRGRAAEGLRLLEELDAAFAAGKTKE